MHEDKFLHLTVFYQNLASHIKKFNIRYVVNAMSQPDKMFKVFSRPQLDLEDFRKFSKVAAYIEEHDLDQEVVEQAEIQVKYSGYIEKEKNNADKLTRLEDMIIPDNFNFDIIQSISIEAKQKLNKIRPRTIAQASRISGVSPSDVSVLLIYMGR
jgi:tRNA uridine 5-carboxymethylaminomethyl modification enzyme